MSRQILLAGRGRAHHFLLSPDASKPFIIDDETLDSTLFVRLVSFGQQVGKLSAPTAADD